RQRSSDIPLLVAHFLEKYKAGSKKISQEAMEALLTYQWPGNIRELENTIERIVILSQADEIGLMELPLEVRVGGIACLSMKTGMMLPEDGCDLEEVELDLIRQALDRSGNSVPKAAKLLGLTTRTLEARMTRLGLS
ncbi:MAG: helix-turn-helix domain-containing protein, partial [Coriobacteriia bacterium]|nr:helix-turn-helix domain-containing protein [Coriobacteriia bacterium]